MTQNRDRVMVVLVRLVRVLQRPWPRGSGKNALFVITFQYNHRFNGCLRLFSTKFFVWRLAAMSLSFGLL